MARWQFAAVIAAGLVVGAGSAVVYMRQGMAPAGGGWMGSKVTGSVDADAWTRARVALSGLLALNRSQALYFVRQTDEAGRPLLETCRYRVSGGPLPGRWWSITVYAPDKLNNFELGWKTSWFNRALRWNGAVYYEKWNDLQYAEQAAGAGITNISNVGGARVYGIETDVQIRPAKGFSLTASGAYNDSALTSDFGNPGKGNFAPAGTRLPVQPKFKMSSTARYEFPVGPVDAFVQGSMNTQTNATSLLGVGDNAVFGNSPGFTTADFSVGGKTGKYTFQLFIQNAFDKRGSLSHNAQIGPANFENTYPAGSSSAHFTRTYPIKPQYFGLKVGTKF